LSGEALVSSIGLYNRLEIIFYQQFNRMEGTIPYGSRNIAIKVMIDLLENVRVNGYSAEETDIIITELQELRMKEAFGKREWLRLYAIYKRIEHILDVESKNSIDDFQKMAERIGRDIKAGDNIWIKNFSSNIFRSDTIYSLSTAVSSAKRQAMHNAGISGWQVVVPGGAEGRVRFIASEEELASVQPDEIIVMEEISPEAPPITRARAIITLREDSLLSHPAIRARQYNIPFVVCPDRRLLDGFEGKWARLKIKGDQVTLKQIKEPSTARGPPQENGVNGTVTIITPDLSVKDTIILPSRYSADTVGNKAFRLAQIPVNLLPYQCEAKHFSLGFGGLFVKTMNLEINAGKRERLEALMQKAVRYPRLKDISHVLAEMRACIMGLVIDEDDLHMILDEAMREFGAEGLIFLRSSTNAEDLPGYAGAGLHDSCGNVKVRRDALELYIKKVWASIWNERAFYDRREHGIDQTGVYMAVLFQQMIRSDYALVVHTRNPNGKNGGEISIEAVQGLGESLVSGDAEYAGAPYRFIYNRTTGRLRIDSFAGKSRKLIIDERARMRRVYASYREDPILTKTGLKVIRDIAKASMAIEEIFLTPQDIEAALIYRNGNWQAAFVQSHDQLKVNGSAQNHAGEAVDDG
jgi:phosphoenolpyruvate synthase/pyruvate phosphate dikinase